MGDDKFMNLKINKKHILKRLFLIIKTTVILTLLKCSMCFAESGIGTAEVETATQNIKRVITSIAMPLGRCSNFC